MPPIRKSVNSIFTVALAGGFQQIAKSVEKALYVRTNVRLRESKLTPSGNIWEKSHRAPKELSYYSYYY